MLHIRRIVKIGRLVLIHAHTCIHYNMYHSLHKVAIWYVYLKIENDCIIYIYIYIYIYFKCNMVILAQFKSINSCMQLFYNLCLNLICQL